MKSMRGRCGIWLWPVLAAAAVVCAAQTDGAPKSGRLTFEVASVKPAAPYFPPEGRGPSERVEWGVDRFTARNTGLNSLMWIAFRVGGGSLSWDSYPGLEARFDIEAKAPGPASRDQMRAMLVSLLEDRFKLVTHFDTKEMMAYVLVTGKNGHKLHEVVGSQDSGWEILNVAGYLSRIMKEPVVDMTGLTGRYDNPLPFRAFNDPEDPESATRAAIVSEFGLALERRRVKVDFLVIDHLEKTPKAN